MSNKALKTVSKGLHISLLLIVLLSATMSVALCASVVNQTNYYGDLDKNYYSFYGAPDIQASVQGNGELKRGQSSTVSLVLSNQGILQGFKSEVELKDSSSIDNQLNMTLQQMEVENVANILTAVGISATLESSNPDILIKTGSQQAGSLPTGQSTMQPLRYTVEIGKDVPAGEYNLTLNVSYKHLTNVIYGADAVTGSSGNLGGIRNLNASYWYNESATQSIPIKIIVKDDTKFEIVEVDNGMNTKGGTLKITYKNVGEIPAIDSFVRLNTATPFSTTDDQSYLGTVNPGETAVATFKMSVDSDTVIYDKLYAINSEILYNDNYGHQQITDSLMVQVQIDEPEGMSPLVIGVVAMIIILIIVGGAYYYFNYYKKGKKLSLKKEKAN
ncbi:hypothetical protein MsAg5_17660 [Methanosarcinaceae archaeon Ag5]|uniref:S-layer protein n=1 Tax=Methanolapillus africanus TaxID=3028297 RepID=A0AAE4SEJ9_9EURY|nr:hypothetical protein [Methanosarcinaceae archaeon Ag5]